MNAPAIPRTVLAVDGALGAFSAAVIGEGFEIADRVAGNAALERGLTLVDHVLSGAGLRLGNLDALAVGVGPGSFTGLRIAVSYAKSLALATGLSLVGISSYDVVEPASVEPPVVSVVRGRPGVACARLRVATGAVGDRESLVSCGTYDRVADALALRLGSGSAREVACCGGVEGVAARFGERGFIVRAYPFPDPPAALLVARLAARRWSRGAARASPHAIRADYGEPPQYVSGDAARAGEG